MIIELGKVAVETQSTTTPTNLDDAAFQFLG
jgi:hypothetical protein